MGIFDFPIDYYPAHLGHLEFNGNRTQIPLYLIPLRLVLKEISVNIIGLGAQKLMSSFDSIQRAVEHAYYSLQHLLTPASESHGIAPLMPLVWLEVAHTVRSIRPLGLLSSISSYLMNFQLVHHLLNVL